MKYTALIISLMLAVSCASHPKVIEAKYVSPLIYKDYDCNQINEKMGEVAQRSGVLYQSLLKERDADKLQMSVGLVFFPTLLLLEGSGGPEETEFSTLKGEYQALHEISVEKNCVITTRSPDEVFRELEAEKKRRSRNDHFIR